MVLNAQEIGGNVVISGSGTLNLAGTTFVGITGTSAGLWPSEAAVVIGSAGSADIYQAAISGPSTTGIGPFASAVLSSGSLFGIDIGAPNWLVVAQGYVSNSVLTASSTFVGTFASLGLNLGTYIWSWGEGDNVDSFTLNVGVAAVPVPAGLPLLAAGLGALGFAGWRKKRSAKTAVAVGA